MPIPSTTDLLVTYSAISFPIATFGQSPIGSFASLPKPVPESIDANEARKLYFVALSCTRLFSYRVFHVCRLLFTHFISRIGKLASRNYLRVTARKVSANSVQLPCNEEQLDRWRTGLVGPPLSSVRIVAAGRERRDITRRGRVDLSEGFLRGRDSPSRERALHPGKPSRIHS